MLVDFGETGVVRRISFFQKTKLFFPLDTPPNVPFGRMAGVMGRVRSRRRECTVLSGVDWGWNLPTVEERFDSYILCVNIRTSRTILDATSLRTTFKTDPQENEDKRRTVCSEGLQQLTVHSEDVEII